MSTGSLKVSTGSFKVSNQSAFPFPLFVEGDVEEAYAHCKSLHISQVFQGSEDWLLSSADVFKRFHVKTQGTLLRVLFVSLNLQLEC